MKEDGRFQPNFENLTPALTSKVEEFKLLGYQEVTKDGIIHYLLSKKWKNVKNEMPLYAMVADILSLRVGDYMNFLTVEAYKAPNFFENIDESELEALLHPPSKRK